MRTIHLHLEELEARNLLHAILTGDLHEGTEPDAVDDVVSAATRAQSGDDRFWEFVDAIVGMRLQRPEDRELAMEILEVVVRHTAHAPRLGSAGRLRR